MQGRNELHINQATMREIVQLWVDKHMSSLHMRVMSVSKDASGGVGPDQFIIRTEVPDPTTDDE